LFDLIRIPSVSVLNNLPVIDYIVETLDSKTRLLFKILFAYCCN